MITKENGGYLVNGQFIDDMAARELSTFIDKEYNKEDVIQEIDSRYGEGTSDKLSDELLSDITEEYHDRRGDSDEWHLYVDAALETFASEINKELDTNKEIE